MKWKGISKAKYIKYNSLDIPSDSEVEFHNFLTGKLTTSTMGPKTKVT